MYSSAEDKLHRESGPAARSPGATLSHCSEKTSSAAELDDVQCSDEPDGSGLWSSRILLLERGSYRPDCDVQTIKMINIALNMMDELLPLCSDQRPPSLLESLSTRQQVVFKSFMKHETVCPADIEVCQYDAPWYPRSYDEVDVVFVFPLGFRPARGAPRATQPSESADIIERQAPGTLTAPKGSSRHPKQSFDSPLIS